MKFLHETHPNGRWWLKADGTDIQEGLRESVRNEWSGDVDLGDGKLQDKYLKYVEYIKFVNSIGMKDMTSSDTIKEDLQKQCSKLSMENEFLVKGHADAKTEYKNLQKVANTSEKALFACAWRVEEYSKLLEKNGSLAQTVTNILRLMESGNTQSINIEATLATLRKELLECVKGT